MQIVVRMQAFVRGWQQRRKYRILYLNKKDNSKYFRDDEAKETLTNDQVDLDADL